MIDFSSISFCILRMAQMARMARMSRIVRCEVRWRVDDVVYIFSRLRGSSGKVWWQHIHAICREGVDVCMQDSKTKEEKVISHLKRVFTEGCVSSTGKAGKVSPKCTVCHDRKRKSDVRLNE